MTLRERALEDARRDFGRAVGLWTAERPHILYSWVAPPEASRDVTERACQLYAAEVARLHEFVGWGRPSEPIFDANPAWASVSHVMVSVVIDVPADAASEYNESKGRG